MFSDYSYNKNFNEQLLFMKKSRIPIISKNFWNYIEIYRILLIIFNEHLNLFNDWRISNICENEWKSSMNIQNYLMIEVF